MIKVLHVSSECYPAAKAGGMGDVVGAVPIYLPKQGVEASVIIPKYGLPWFKSQKYQKVKDGGIHIGGLSLNYTVQKVKNNNLGYPLYVIDMPGLFDRPSIYLDTNGEGYHDEPVRNIAFQTIVCEWLLEQNVYDIVHCHDHMTGMIPFFLKYGTRYKPISDIPTMFTIHNGMYHGSFPWDIGMLLPKFDFAHRGILDWDGRLNSLATAIKCADKVNTVSPNYMEEIMQTPDSFRYLYMSEGHKCMGILNGVDTNLWNPKTDKYLDNKMEGDNLTGFKATNKKSLLSTYKLKSRRPLIGFIGRMAHQKGADLLAKAIEENLEVSKSFCAIILGSGDSYVENELSLLAEKYPGYVHTIIAYNESIARSLYAGCDYMIMPSRFEPCGLNQLFSYRYGTIPIASPVGGLVDTVIDIDNKKGTGILLNEVSQSGISEAISRSCELYQKKTKFNSLRKHIIDLDYSWDQSASIYASIYRQLLKL